MKLKFITSGLLLSLLFLTGCDDTEVVYEIPQENKQRASEWIEKMEAEGNSLSYCVHHATELFGVAIYTIKDGKVMLGTDRRDSVGQTVTGNELMESSTTPRTVLTTRPIESSTTQEYENEILKLKTEITLLKAKVQHLEIRARNEDAYEWMKR